MSTRQQRRAALQNMDKEMKRIMKERTKPATKMELIAVTNHFGEKIEKIDHFLTEKYGDEWLTYEPTFPEDEVEKDEKEAA